MSIMEDFKEKLKKLKENNELTSQNLQNLIVNTLNSAAKNNENINEISKNIFTEAIKQLQDYGLVNKKYIKTVIESVLLADMKDLKKAIDELNEEKKKIQNKLQEFQNKLSEKINFSLENIKIISDDFDEEIKQSIQECVNEIASQNEKAVFQMQKNIKNEIKKALNNNKNMDLELTRIINENIKKAIQNSELTISQAKEIFKKAIMSVKEISDELQLDVQKNIAIAVKTIENYMLEEINSLKNSLDESKNDIKDFIQKDTQKTLENLEIIYIGMIEAIGEFSQKSDKLLQEELNDMRKKIAELKDETREILIQKIEILKEESEEALNRAKEKTKILTDEMKQKLENLSVKIAKVTKAAFNGMIEGAKKALEEEKK